MNETTFKIPADFNRHHGWTIAEAIDYARRCLPDADIDTGCITQVTAKAAGLAEVDAGEYPVWVEIEFGEGNIWRGLTVRSEYEPQHRATPAQYQKDIIRETFTTRRWGRMMNWERVHSDSGWTETYTF